MTPVLADLDRDGDIEIIVTGAYLAVWDLPGTYDPTRVEWPMYQHDPQRVGRYRQCRSGTPADLNGDGVVSTPDLHILFSAWGSNPAHRGDLTGDGTVDAQDVRALVAQWGSWAP